MLQIRKCGLRETPSDLLVTHLNRGRPGIHSHFCLTLKTILLITLLTCFTRGILFCYAIKCLILSCYTMFYVAGQFWEVAYIYDVPGYICHLLYINFLFMWSHDFMRCLNLWIIYLIGLKSIYTWCEMKH